MNQSIIERDYYILEVKLLSPLCVSSGIDKYTDSDVMRNSAGELFIPGTSLAGAFRSYFEQQKNKEGAFGFADGQKGEMSPIHISDLYFEKDSIKISIRDGIRLDDKKQAKDRHKYDMEIIETGANGKIYIQCIKRNNKYFFDEIIQKIVSGLNEGEIRIGANKNRGFGRFEVVAVYKKTFTSDSVKEWIEFLENWKDKTKYDTVKKICLSNPAGDFHAKYIKMSIPLKQNGGISIRKYSTVPGKADYEHITCNEEPVIPGTSWNGAIRAQVKKILHDFGAKKKNEDSIVEEWFGTEEKQSKIVICESIIKNGKQVPVTRNAINRFSAGTTTGALYSEIACFNGETQLEFIIKKDTDYKAILGMLYLVVEDIKQGYLSVGGQTAIGRGIFELNGDIECCEEKEDCIEALYKYCMETGKNEN